MSNYKVLVVDDERMIREGIADMIDWRALGLTLAGTAPDGQSAYLAIAEMRPDIVITDIKMPKLSGLELIQKTQTEFSGMTFIVLSGYGEFELAAQAMKFGVKHYLLKPSNEEEIIQVLHEVTAELDIHRSKERQWEGMQRQLAESGSGQAARMNAFYMEAEGGGASVLQQESADYDAAVDAAGANAVVWSAEEDEYVRAIAAAVRNGEEAKVKSGLAVFFHALFEKRPEAKFATGRCMELLDAVFKEAALAFGYKKESDGVRIWQMKTLQEIQHYITEELSAIMGSQPRSDKRSRVIARIKQLTDDHLENRQLSLQWLAQHHLFLNSEYLGKLFRQETGEKYTRYLTIKRMEKAKELIESLPQLKMYEIAERCGFEQDPQYFANVFKKIYDCSPAEYRKRISGTAE